MVESSLALSHDTLADAVSRFLAYGDDYTNIGSTAQGYVDSIITSGLRRFYMPVPLGGSQHKWTFLRPVGSIVLRADAAVSATTVSGGAEYPPSTIVTANTGTNFYAEHVGQTITIQETADADYVIDGYTSATVITVTGDASGASADLWTIASSGIFGLPEDFGYFLGRPTFAYQEAYLPLEMISDEQIREMQQNRTTTGKPLYGAVRPLKPVAGGYQRFALIVWPTPDDTYNISFRYHVLGPTMDTTTQTKPYGGAAHSETILESCLAVAEERENDERGLHHAVFMECLAASIEYDKNLGPQTLGYNGDDTDGREERLGDRVPAVTYNNVQY